jgi:2,3-bisphosphoglycerate-dependent phosphoglycerate mutase
MVRHGETDWNANRRFQGWTDVALTDVGRAQATMLAESLVGLRFHSVWSSDLTRAVETARLAYGEPVADHRLRELNFGDLEGSVWEDLTPSLRAELVAFDGFAAPGGESMGEFKARIVEFLDALPAGDHLVVTHGGVIRMVTRECGSDGFPGHADVVMLDWTNRTRVDDIAQ